MKVVYYMLKQKLPQFIFHCIGLLRALIKL